MSIVAFVAVLVLGFLVLVRWARADRLAVTPRHRPRADRGRQRRRTQTVDDGANRPATPSRTAYHRTQSARADADRSRTVGRRTSVATRNADARGADPQRRVGALRTR